ncbi:oligosaccharide flippase family protein [Flavobacterium sp. DG1-102-2]|uniref:lipopolysaccharide biosynthesis protein n=1 Tax=Flavobacterium sp. DG1-102-2 TaxID=3081663 RepID=UPI00294A40C4|nr:oligosaccharide flippase family protein [Flavobacterium sp. DG1-102-2]MDV6168258.1 oligosaccharide flippase family protein [Flavobacterium sp. DG1-102-2]
MEKRASTKQVLLYSLINYLGTAIGVVSTILVYPKDKALLGTVRYVDNISQLLFPIMVLGASHALIKFYPALSEEKQKQLFNYSIFSISMISLLVFAGVMIYTGVSDDKRDYLIFFGFPIGVSLAFIELFRKQAQDLQKLAVPTLFEKIFPKIVLPAVFLLFLHGYISQTQSILYYTICYIVIFILTAVYLFKYFKPGFNYRFKTLFGEITRKDYFRYSLYAFAGSLGSLLAFRLDGIIIFRLLSEEANGTFSIGVALASVLQIPAIGMFALYAPIVSNHLKAETFTELQKKYVEVAKLLFGIGALLFCCVFLGIQDLFRLLPTYNNLKDSIPIVNILSFSVLINMATGFNSEIITYSKYYRFNLIAISILIALSISLNLYFIYVLNLGIVGVAYASFISMTLFNISKLVFIYKKFRLLPFDKGFGVMALIFTASTAVIYYLPDTGCHFINLVYKTGLSLVINIVVLYKLKLVFQMNMWMDKGLKFLKIKS